MSACRAIIPVKDLDCAKTRLGALLSHGERISLSLEMLRRVLGAVLDVDGLSPLVVSRDQRALEVALAAGAGTLQDRWTGLNASLEAATRWCAEKGAESVLVLHADLPLLRSEDVRAMIGLGPSGPAMVLAPCRRDEGTNALFLRPPGAVPLAFGKGSFRAHLEMASRHGIAAVVYRSPAIALDVDTEADLEAFRLQAALSRGGAS